MRAKKTKEADLESRRKGFLLVGLTVACAFSLTAFEWITPERSISFIPPLPPIDRIEQDVPVPIVLERKVEKKAPVEAPKKVSIHGTIAELPTKEEAPPEEESGTESAPLSYENEIPEPETGEDLPVEFGGVMPSFPGGAEALFAFLDEQLVYPRIAVTGSEEGTVFVSFLVSKSGKISDVKVIRGVSPALDQEAIRVVKRMPDWSPGISKGELATFIYRLPVKFTLR